MINSGRYIEEILYIFSSEQMMHTAKHFTPTHFTNDHTASTSMHMLREESGGKVIRNGL